MRAQVRLTPGARTLVRTLKRLGYAVAVVSGGFTAVTDDLVRLLGLDHARANVLEVVDGRLTGGLVGPGGRPGRQGRRAARVRRREGLTTWRRPSRSATARTTSTCSPPPGSASPSTPSRWSREAADAAISVPFLDAVLFLLGIPREEVEAADASWGVSG